MSHGSNGTPPAGPTAEEQELLAQALEQAIEQIAFSIIPFAPHLGSNQRALLDLAESSMREQNEINEKILPTVFDESLAKKYPTIVIEVWHGANADAPGAKRIRIIAPKSLAEVSDPGHAAQHAMLMALLLQPTARAILRAWGFKYTFAQTPTPSGGRLVVPSV